MNLETAGPQFIAQYRHYAAVKARLKLDAESFAREKLAERQAALAKLQAAKDAEIAAQKAKLAEHVRNISITAKINAPTARSGASFALIAGVICDLFEVTPNDMIAAHRAAVPLRARQAAMWLAKELTPMSFPEIGRRLHRDHSTVLYGARIARARMQHEPIYAGLVYLARDRIERLMEEAE